MERKLATQPGTGHGPFALDARQGNADHSRRFLERESAEVTQLDDAALRLVDLLKPVQCLVDGEYVDTFVVKGVQRLALVWPP